MIGIQDYNEAERIYNKGRAFNDEAEPVECFSCASCGKEQEKPALCNHDKYCNTCCWIMDNGFPTVEALERDLIKAVKHTQPRLEKGLRWFAKLTLDYHRYSDSACWVVFIGNLNPNGERGKFFSFELSELEAQDKDQNNKLGKTYVEMLAYAAGLEG